MCSFINNLETLLAIATHVCARMHENVCSNEEKSEKMCVHVCTYASPCVHAYMGKYELTVTETLTDRMSTQHYMFILIIFSCLLMFVF